MTPHVPQLWFVLCASMFDCDGALAEKLWEMLPHRDLVTWELQVMQRRGRNYNAALNRTRRLATILTPQVLLDLAVRLEPEGQPRSRAIRRFEAAILNMMTQEGTWQW